MSGNTFATHVAIEPANDHRPDPGGTYTFDRIVTADDGQRYLCGTVTMDRARERVISESAPLLSFLPRTVLVPRDVPVRWRRRYRDSGTPPLLAGRSPRRSAMLWGPKVGAR